MKNEAHGGAPLLSASNKLLRKEVQVKNGKIRSASLTQRRPRDRPLGIGDTFGVSSAPVLPRTAAKISTTSNESSMYRLLAIQDGDLLLQPALFATLLGIVVPGDDGK